MKKVLRLLLIILLLIPFQIKADAFEIDSQKVILLNLTNNETIYEKGKDDIIKVASMQKVMTALVAIENLDNLDEKIVIPYGMFSSLDSDLAVAGFYAGENLTYNDLLYATLLKSGADAAYALGIYVAGSEEEYVKMMNEKAKSLGLKNTVFKNTTGLDAEGQYSTVSDIAILFKYALNNKDFKRIVSTDNYTTTDGEYLFHGPVDAAKKRGMDYFLGGKTGYTEEAGLCLVSYASAKGIDYLLVTAGADYHKNYQNFYDQKTIYDYYINNYSFTDVIKKGKIIDKVKTIYDEQVIIKAPRNVKLYLNNSIFIRDLDIVFKQEKELDRTIKKGDKIGKYEIKYKDTVLYEEDILSPITVKFRIKKEYVLVLLIILLSILIHLSFRKASRKRRRKLRKKL